MPRILVVAKAYPPLTGGVETYSEEVVKAYLRRSFECTVITQTSGPIGWQFRHYPEGRVRFFNTGLAIQPRVFWRMLLALSKLSLGSGFDAIHATTWRPALACLPFSRKTPLALTVHGREVLNFPFILKHAMIEVLRRSDCVATVSHATMEVAHNALGGIEPKGKWTVSFNGITHAESARAFNRLNTNNENPLRLLSLARLVPRKNIQGCIKALSEIRKEGHANFIYQIAGKGPMQAELMKLTEEVGLQENIEFLGYIADSELPYLYQSSDVFLHPQTHVGEGNDFEGFGLVIADAMSFGCAVLAGDAGGPKDFIKNNVTGMIVDGLDAIQLKDAIRALMLDSDLRNRLSSAGKQYALTNLSWDNHIDAIITALPPLKCDLG